MQKASADLRLKRCLILLAIALIAGCHQAVSVPATTSTTQPAAGGIGELGVGSRESGVGEPAGFAEPPADDLDGGQLVEEYWDAYSMQDPASAKPVRVGYARTTVARFAERGRELLRTRNFTRTEWNRGGQKATQELTITSWDTPDGELVRFETRMSAGTSSPDAQPMEVVAVGGVRDGQLGRLGRPIRS